MMFCQLGRAHSLRGISGGLKSFEGKLVHLGIEAQARSSLSCANSHRPWQSMSGSSVVRAHPRRSPWHEAL